MISVTLTIDPEEQERIDKLFEHRFINMPDRFGKVILKPLAHSARKKALRRIWDRDAPRHWAPLSGATLYQKRRLGFPRDILVRTKALRRSLTIAADPQHVTRMFKTGPGNYVIVLGSRDPKVPIHHEGSAKVNLPQRPLLPNIPILEAWAVLHAEKNVLIPNLEADLRRPMSAR
jgi:hypothetical protein